MTRLVRNPVLVLAALAVSAVGVTWADDGSAFASLRLPTHGDADSLLERAAGLLHAGQHAQAVMLLQLAMDKFPNALTTADDRRYAPARLQARQMIADAGPEALGVYRLTADGRARGLLGGPANPTRDPAALREVVDRYFLSSEGDESAYALACLMLDRREPQAARRLLRLVQHEHPDPSIPPAELHARVALASAMVGDAAGARRAISLLAEIPHADPQRIALLRAQLPSDEPDPDALPLPRGDDPRGWVEVWRYRLPVVSRTDPPRRAPGPMVEQADRVYFKNDRFVFCLDSRTGTQRWRQPASPQPDRADGAPRSDDLAAIGQGLYHVVPGGVLDRRPTRKQVRRAASLVALDAATGQRRWEVLRVERLDHQRERVRARFLAAPVACGRFVVAPALLDNELHLVAIDPETGRTAWTVFCCGDAEATDNDRPLAMAAHDDRVYLVSGRGVVLAIDGLRGRLDWATRYQRQASDVSRSNAVGLLDGRLIAMAADAPGRLMQFDAADGAPLGQLDLAEATRWIGQRGDRVYLASDCAVQCVRSTARDLTESWRAAIAPTGRAVVTGRSVLVPTANRLIQLDAAEGAPIAAWPRPDGADNLSIHQARLIALRPTGVVAWVEGESHLAALSRRAEAGDGEARIARAALLHRLGHTEGAIDALRAVASPEATPRLVRLLLAAGRLDEAAVVATTPALRAAVTLARARRLDAGGRTAEAETLYARLLDADGNPMVALDWQGHHRAQVSRIARQRLDRTPDDADAGPAFAPTSFGPPPWRMVWRYGGAGVRLLVIDHPTARRSRFWDRHLLFYSPGWGQLICRRAADRQAVWTMAAGGDFAEAVRYDQRGPTLRAAVCGQMLVIRSDARLFGLDQHTGEVRWQRDLPPIEPGMGYFNDGPLTAADADENLVIHLHADPATGIDHVEAIDPASGRLRWRRRLPHHTVRRVRLTDAAVVLGFVDPAERWICNRQTGEKTDVVVRPPSSNGVTRHASAAIGPHGLTWRVDYGNRQQPTTLTVTEPDADDPVLRIEHEHMPAAHTPPETLARCGGWIPFVDQDQKMTNRAHVVFYRLTDGKRLDATLRAPAGRGGFDNLRQPPIVRDGLMMIASDAGVMAFGSTADGDAVNRKTEADIE